MDKLLLELQKKLKPYKQINFALLFGSYAKEQNNELSDIDIAIYSNKDFSLLELGEIISNLEDYFAIKTDIVLIKELYKNNPKLAFNICDNHKIIFCNDQKEYINFKTNSLKYYFDTKYMYDIFDTALQKRLEDGTYGQTQAS